MFVIDVSATHLFLTSEFIIEFTPECPAESPGNILFVNVISEILSNSHPLLTSCLKYKLSNTIDILHGISCLLPLDSPLIAASSTFKLKPKFKLKSSKEVKTTSLFNLNNLN